ncbi:uncharacterized protein LOC131144084 [Malania oleifera]|uniref:uncharacterized protein LOC131144084 n=1 Tax=Malania oleifera TaxID=397392 RepID=UPI0025AE8F1B|nr:uncharacterized protein LOC131144084 [Malania oleifera]XP_057948448.1 uncharacterized protein LOC131144084 [Malania oleifera]XP_057948451.1 uncharacterized protein LOC131144084 [Malania oleifera]
MDAAAGATTRIKSGNILASPTTGRMANATNVIQQAWPSTRPEKLTLYAGSGSFSTTFPCHHQRCMVPNSRNGVLFLTHCSTKPGVDSDNATNKNAAIELGSSSTAQQPATPPQNQTLASGFTRGLLFDLGPKNSWDGVEIGSPVVKRYIGDDEERWYMWYHGRSDRSNASDSIGLAVSNNGIHWARGAEHVRSCGDAGLVMNCRNNWWAFDTEGVRPSELVIMSSPMYSAVYWLYYTGFSSEEVEFSEVPNFHLENPERIHRDDKKDENGANSKILKSLPGLACSQDGRHWARIEGDHHSGALFDVGSGKDWDSLFIAAPHVVIHNSDDLRMYYHSYDVENKQFAIGIARSRDGIRWVKLGKIIGGGLSGSFDELGVMNACVVRNKNDGNYLMAYEGVAADGNRSIGLAKSSDGLKNWIRAQIEPVLKPSTEDGWDNRGVGFPSLVQMDGNAEEWRLYYKGVGQEGRTGIGMAASEGSEITSFRRWAGFHL